jgi:hypothetical protein
MKIAPEAIITVALYALAALLAASSVAGLVLATAWLGIGLYMVANSRSRGIWADASFLVTWPIYWLAGR